HAGLKLVAVLLLVLAVLVFGRKLLFGQRRLAGIDDDVRGEVEHQLQGPRRHVQQQPHAGRDALEEPDVRHGRGQLDVAHALPTHLGAGDLHAAAVAHDAAVAHPLVLAAVALPVLRRTENPLAVQTVPLGLEAAVVDGFRLYDLTAGPGPNLLGRGEPDA